MNMKVHHPNRDMPQKGSESSVPVVLVGTYREVNAEWIREHKCYNLPLPDDLDATDEKALAFHRRFTHVVLYAHDHAPIAQRVRLVKVVGQKELTEIGYKPPKPPHKSRAERYALYEFIEKASASRLLADPQADVFVVSSRCPSGLKIDADFYAKPLPNVGGQSIPNVFEKLKPSFKKWHSAVAFNPVQLDFFALFNDGTTGELINFGKRPIAIDLFAGCGGLSLGFEQAGFDIAAAVEIDPIHAAVHEYNFPYSKTICADIKNVDGNQIRELAGIGDRDVDVVFGGAPCQGFSMIGKRALDDPRNQLIKHYLRIVGDIRPKFCVLENVKGLTVGKHAKFLQELISELQKIKYQVLLPYRVLNAADYGVPQNRERLFLIAARADQTLPAYPAAIDEKVTIRDAISDLPDADKFEQLLSDDSVDVRWQTQSRYGRRLRGLEEDPGNFGYTRACSAERLTASRRTIHTEETQRRFVAAPQGETEPHSRFFKLAWGGQSNTLRAGTDSARGGFTSPRPIHPELARVITVREGARIHSYPDWFRFNKTKWHGFREIGNSVPPLLARAVGAEIVKVLGVHPKKPDCPIRPGAEALLEFDMGRAAEHFGVSRNVIAQRRRKDNGR